jgi:hypothetical protein
MISRTGQCLLTPVMMLKFSVVMIAPARIRIMDKKTILLLLFIGILMPGLLGLGFEFEFGIRVRFTILLFNTKAKVGNLLLSQVKKKAIIAFQQGFPVNPRSSEFTRCGKPQKMKNRTFPCFTTDLYGCLTVAFQLMPQPVIGC